MQQSGTNQIHQAQFWIDHLQLKPHPEGGYYRETYRSGETIPQQALPARFDGDRTFCTSILFLLVDRNFSAFHRIKQDELWHFYDGKSLKIHVIDEAKSYREISLGKNILAGECLQAVVPAGAWFASHVADFQGFSLVGCTVAPGFEFEDFEMADRSCLIESFPQHRPLIERLTR